MSKNRNKSTRNLQFNSLVSTKLPVDGESDLFVWAKTSHWLLIQFYFYTMFTEGSKKNLSILFNSKVTNKKVYHEFSQNTVLLPILLSLLWRY